MLDNGWKQNTITQIQVAVSKTHEKKQKPFNPLMLRFIPPTLHSEV